MKFCLDRINDIRGYYFKGLLPYLLPHETFGRVHEILNELDKAAGISTAWHDGHVCSVNPEVWWCEGNHNNPRQVGARVALHEEHLAAIRAAA